MAFPKLSEPTTARPFAPLEEAKKYLKMLLNEEHDYRLLILDTLSSLEPKLINALCISENVRSIKAACGGYGRGYDVLVSYWQEILDLILQLRTKKKWQCCCCATPNRVRYATAPPRKSILRTASILPH